uniref:Origin recognition complex subunit 2 n=1 Tax=Denticeps clupeoides TaxID=299321 RepID=A0AAY4AUX0_9TELE
VSGASAALDVRFVADSDVLDHIVDKQDVAKASKSSVQTLVTLNKKRLQNGPCDPGEEDETEENLNEQNYVNSLGTEAEDGAENGTAATTGSSVFTFHTTKRSNKMAQMASEWARTPGKSVTFNAPESPEETPSPSRGSKSEDFPSLTGKKVQFVSNTPHRLRKRLTGPNLKSESDSDFSSSNSEEEDQEEEGEKKLEPQLKTPRKSATSASAAALYKTPSKKSKKAPEPNLVEEYFEAHSSSKVLTSDRTLQKLQTPRLDRDTLLRLLDGKPSCYSSEIDRLNKTHEKHFSKWMLQLDLGFNILLYGLGSKKNLLEKFRTSMLSDIVHLVVNGFFPSITLKSFISVTVSSLKTQQALGQLASIPNMHLLASIDHINAPLVWDQSKMSMFNWLWYETTSYLPYTEETSYENSLLVQQTGALALSSLTHVLRSLTPNARGIFRLLAEFQLEHKDDPSYTGLSFQDFYQRCREAFLVNSDITLRTQLTEFRDHKLIRTKKGVDGVEYLLIPVDAGTLTDFLEKEDVE